VIPCRRRWRKAAVCGDAASASRSCLERTCTSVRACVRVCVCMRACVRACVRACACVRVRAVACMFSGTLPARLQTCVHSCAPRRRDGAAAPSDGGSRALHFFLLYVVSGNGGPGSGCGSGGGGGGGGGGGSMRDPPHPPTARPRCHGCLALPEGRRVHVPRARAAWQVHLQRARAALVAPNSRHLIDVIPAATGGGGGGRGGQLFDEMFAAVAARAAAGDPSPQTCGPGRAGPRPVTIGLARCAVLAVAAAADGDRLRCLTCPRLTAVSHLSSAVLAVAAAAGATESRQRI
jgi:hypothetical protein